MAYKKRPAAPASPPPKACSSIVRIGPSCVLTISGEIDLVVSARLAPDLNEIIRSSDGALVVDLTAVTFLDSTGLALLLNAKRRLEQRERRLVVVCPTGDVRRTFEMTRLAHLFELHARLDGALTSAAEEAPERTSPDPTAPIPPLSA